MHPGCDVGLEVAFLKVAFSSKVAEADALYQERLSICQFLF